MKKISNVHNLQVFSLLLIAYLLLAYISAEYIITNEIYYNSFSNNLPIEDINSIISLQDKYSWIAYPLQLISLALKVYFTGACIYVGLLLGQQKIRFRRILKVVLFSEMVFILYSMARIVVLLSKDFSTLEQIQVFWPLSLFSFFQADSIPQWLFYPLYTINIAEIAYWLVLALGLTYLMKTKFLQSLKTVLTSYGAGLLLWMCILVFAQLYFLEPV